MYRYFYILVIFLSLGITAEAQDAHYWTEQYGTKSMLLSNSVVGSVEDLGAVYYNPGRLGLIYNPALLLSAKIYQISKMTLKNAVGEGWNLNKSKFGSVPSLLAGTFRFKKLPKHKFAYSFLVRNRADDNFSTRSDTVGDVVNVIPGVESFNGEIGFNKKFKEDWTGLTWSYAIKENFGVGVSTYFATKHQESYTDVVISSYSEANDVDVYLDYKRYSYTDYGLVWKIGASYEYKKFRFGMTFTTPTLSIMGDGKFAYRNVYTGAGGEPKYNVFYQKNIDLKYHTPWSIAGGFSADMLKGTLHFSGEYFGKIERYNMLVSDEFFDEVNDEGNQLILYNELRPVFNFGVGYDVVFSEKISAYLSYSTNKSAAVSSGDNYGEDTFELLASTFKSNINNLGFGIVMNFNETNVTFGATYAYAGFLTNRPVDFPGDNSTSDSIIDPDAKTKVEWDRWRLIVGISVPFLRDVARKVESDWKSKRKSKKKNKETEE